MHVYIFDILFGVPDHDDHIDYRFPTDGVYWWKHSCEKTVVCVYVCVSTFRGGHRARLAKASVYPFASVGLRIEPRHACSVYHIE